MPNTYLIQGVERAFGWKRQLPHQQGRLFVPSIKEYALPASADLRPYDTPIKDQGQLGSCTSFAGTGDVKFVRKMENLEDKDLSELFVYYNERVVEGTTSYDSGASIADIITVTEDKGVCSEASWPYDISKYTEKPPDACYTEGASNKVNPDAYQIPDGDITSVKSALAEGFPVIIGFTVYSSFENIGSDGIMPYPKKGESVLGGHAVLLLGYDDPKQWMIVRNSWSKDWGASGYFFMPYKVITNKKMSGDFWVIKSVTGSSPGPGPQPPPDPTDLEARVKALETWKGTVDAALAKRVMVVGV